MIHALPADARRRPAPLALVLPFTFLSSMSCGTISSGIYFITKQGYSFSKVENFLLALVQGLAYMLGAALAGRVVSALRASTPRMTTRAILVAVLLLLGAICMLPALARGSAAIWLVVGLYSPLNGMLWPIVESYVSGGRAERDLRAAIGAWNVTWGGALVVSFAAIAPLCEGAPALAIALLGAVHLASVALVLAFPKEPAAHVLESHAPSPPEYARLLRAFRLLLPLTTFLLSALSPLLPEVFAELRVPERAASALAGMWLLPRTLTFFVLMRWHGWHGARWLAPLGSCALILGFAASVLGAYAGGGLPVTCAGLVLFGVGMATLYLGALYYAMEVGHAQVHAGGGHEARIGVGFSAGPAVALLASGMASATGVPERSHAALVAAVAVGLSCLVVAFALKSRRRECRRDVS